MLCAAGGGLSDDLSLYLHHGYKDTTLAIVPGFVNQSKPLVKLRVERDSSANFTVYASDSLLFMVTDSTLLRSTTLSIYCKYTSTRVDKFLFSTLHASGYDFQDTLGPECEKIDVLDPFTLSVTWNEWAKLTPFPDRNYALVYSGESVDTAFVTNHFDEQWHLSLTEPLAQGSLGVLLPNAQDALSFSSSCFCIRGRMFTTSQKIRNTRPNIAYLRTWSLAKIKNSPVKK